MRRIAIILVLLSSAALAQPQAPQRPVDIRLTASDQADAVAMCAMAMRSPQITDADQIVTLGAFCARLRGLILDARRKADEPAETPKE